MRLGRGCRSPSQPNGAHPRPDPRFVALHAQYPASSPQGRPRPAAAPSSPIANHHQPYLARSNPDPIINRSSGRGRRGCGLAATRDETATATMAIATHDTSAINPDATSAKSPDPHRRKSRTTAPPPKRAPPAASANGSAHCRQSCECHHHRRADTTGAGRKHGKTNWQDHWHNKSAMARAAAQTFRRLLSEAIYGCGLANWSARFRARARIVRAYLNLSGPGFVRGMNGCAGSATIARPTPTSAPPGRAGTAGLLSDNSAAIRPERHHLSNQPRPDEAVFCSRYSRGGRPDVRLLWTWRARGGQPGRAGQPLLSPGR